MNYRLFFVLGMEQNTVPSVLRKVAKDKEFNFLISCNEKRLHNTSIKNQFGESEYNIINHWAIDTAGYTFINDPIAALSLPVPIMVHICKRDKPHIAFIPDLPPVFDTDNPEIIIAEFENKLIATKARTKVMLDIIGKDRNSMLYGVIQGCNMEQREIWLKEINEVLGKNRLYDGYALRGLDPQKMTHVDNIENQTSSASSNQENDIYGGIDENVLNSFLQPYRHGYKNCHILAQVS